MTLRQLLPLTIFLLSMSSGEAREFDVCTESDLNSAIKTASPGDEILMCSREWRDLDLLFEGQGSASAPITLRSRIPGEAIITGRSQIRMAGSYLVLSGLRFQDGFPVNSAVWFRKSSSAPCNNCRLTESSFIDFTPAANMPEFNEYQFYVRLHGKNNRVDHNYFTGKHGMGQVIAIEVTADGPESHRIDHNYFGHRSVHPSGNNAEAIKIGAYTAEFFESGSIIESNYFHRSNGEFEIVSVKASGVTLRRNTFDRCEGSLSLRHGNGSWVDGNVFLGHRDESKKVSGIRVSGEDHVITNNYLNGIKVGGSDGRGGINLASGKETYYEGGRVAARNVLIAFNTIVDSDRSVSVDSSEPVAPSDIVIANNIISSSHGPLIAEDVAIKGVDYSSNLAYGAELGVSAGGFEIADPELEFQNGVFRLSSTSPAIDNANGLFTPASYVRGNAAFTDFEEQPRSVPFDIGADEYAGASGFGLTKVCDTGPRTYEPMSSLGCNTIEDVAPNPPELFSATQ